MTMYDVKMITVFLDNHWTHIYHGIIESARGRTKRQGDGLERHHIVPKSFFKSYSKSGWLDGYHNEPTNLIVLTAREHMVCHRLLVRMTEGMALSKMAHALNRMTDTPDKRQRYRVSSRMYEYIQIAALESNSTLVTAAHARPEVKANVSAAQQRRWSDPEERRKQSDRAHAAVGRPEVMARIAAANREINSRPDVLAKNSAANSGLKNARADHTVWMFQHLDGRIEHSTRYEFTVKHNINIKPLFKSKPTKIALGWQVIGKIS